MSQKVTSGRMVRYILNELEARQINHRRQDAEEKREAMRKNRPGFQAHVGSLVVGGMDLPMMVVLVTGSEDAQVVSGQVFLDGNDTLWVRSAREGTVPGTWHWPERV